MKVTVSETFKDWDGITVFAGQSGELVRCGIVGVGPKRFWNIVDNGKVVAVSVGRPPVTPSKAQ